VFRSFENAERQLEDGEERPVLGLLRPALKGLGAAGVVICVSTYCAVSYLHYKHIAVDEGRAAQRAERANIDLQDALDRLRDELVAAQAHTNTLDNEATGQILKSEEYKVDRIAQLARMLEQVPLDLRLTDPQPATFAARLSWEPANLADAQTQQSRASVSVDQNQRRLQQLAVERDEAIAERDQLRTRVSELQQKLSLSQSGQSPGRAATAPPDDASGANSLAGGVPAVPPRSAAGAPPAAEQLRQGVKNFAAPGWVPDHFNGESGPILGDPVPRPARRASTRKDAG